MTAGEAEPATVRVGMGRISVRMVGEGEPLLLMMGIGGNLHMWRPLSAHLPDRRLIMFDFPGTGGSTLSPLPPTMGWNAVVVREMLRRLGLGRVDVLGYSWGGLLAQHLALQHPRSVRRLILAATTVGLGGVPPRPAVAARLLTPRRYYSRDHFRAVAPTLYGGRYRRDPAVVEAHAQGRLGSPPSLLGYAAQLAAVAGYSALPGLPFLRAPTLVIGGGDDPIVPTANLRIMSRAIPRSELVIVPGAGHLLLLDSPEVVAPVIERFLSAP